jgi:hypothetical protein
MAISWAKWPVAPKQELGTPKVPGMRRLARPEAAMECSTSGRGPVGHHAPRAVRAVAARGYAGANGGGSVESRLAQLEAFTRLQQAAIRAQQETISDLTGELASQQKALGATTASQDGHGQRWEFKSGRSPFEAQRPTGPHTTIDRSAAAPLARSGLVGQLGGDPA